MISPQVYVYATDGYTETAIKDFLVKINPNVSWVVRSPELAKMPKKAYSNPTIPRTGRTGVSLESFMIKNLKEHPRNLTLFFWKMILIIVITT